MKLENRNNITYTEIPSCIMHKISTIRSAILQYITPPIIRLEEVSRYNNMTLQGKVIYCNKSSSLVHVSNITFQDCFFIGHTIEQAHFRESTFNNCIFAGDVLGIDAIDPKKLLSHLQDVHYHNEGNMKSASFKNSAFNNCTFYLANILDSLFSGSQFHTCVFERSIRAIDSCFDDSIWHHCSFNGTVVDFKDCDMKNISNGPAELNHPKTAMIPFPSYVMKHQSSGNVFWCTEFESDDAVSQNGGRKHVVAVRLRFDSLDLETPVLIFISSDQSEGEMYKMMFLVEYEMSFPTFHMHPGILYSIPNGQSSNSLRQKLIEIASDRKYQDHGNDYYYAGYGGIIHMPEPHETQEFRVFRPANMGNKYFAESVARCFKSAYISLK